jgi:hypothetical protein
MLFDSAPMFEEIALARLYEVVTMRPSRLLKVCQGKTSFDPKQGDDEGRLNCQRRNRAPTGRPGAGGRHFDGVIELSRARFRSWFEYPNLQFTGFAVLLAICMLACAPVATIFWVAFVASLLINLF